MFFYELHSHTNAASLCSLVEPEDYIKFYIDRGFSGMVITDHFYHGNTAVDRHLSWETFVDEFCEGYFRAKREGDKHNFKVFFGFEQKFCDGNDEYIVLGISPDYLKAHPELKDMSRVSFFKQIREVGGFVIQAHPFRERYYVSDIRLSLDYVDAIEVLNMGDKEMHSRRSYEYAKNLGLPMTAGSDIHSIIDFPVAAGIALENEISTIEELIATIKEGKYRISPFDMFEKIKNHNLDENVELSVLNLENGKLTPTDNYFAKKL